MDKTFNLRSLQEATKFESFFNRYAAEKTGSGGNPATENYLATLYSHCHKHCENGKFFNAVIDLEFTFLFMQLDVEMSAGIWNERFSPKHPQVDSILQDFYKFSGKMDILYSFNSFAFRCRSFWDKYLGVLILLYDEEKYDQYSKARSRKRQFKRIANQWTNISPHIQICLAKTMYDLNKRSENKTTLRADLEKGGVAFPSPFIETLLDLIAGLDIIRTAEAHGTGMLRKWSLSTLPLEKTRDFGLINHWNIANDFMKALQKTILDRAALMQNVDVLPA